MTGAWTHARERSQNGALHPVQLLAHVLGKKAQHEVAVFLQQQVLAAVAAVGGWIGKMLVAIDFHGDAGVRSVVAQKIDFHLSLAIESDRQHGVEAETSPRLRQGLEAAVQEGLVRARARSAPSASDASGRATWTNRLACAVSTPSATSLRTLPA